MRDKLNYDEKLFFAYCYHKCIRVVLILHFLISYIQNIVVYYYTLFKLRNLVGFLIWTEYIAKTL